MEEQADLFSTDWISSEPYSAQAVAWGDWDNDGDLDVVMGGKDLKVYANEGERFVLKWQQNDLNVQDVSWGDFDNDSDLDIAIAGYSLGSDRVQVFQNNEDSFQSIWISHWVYNFDSVKSVAWGYLDDDSYADLAVATLGNNYVFTSNGQTLNEGATWTSLESDTSQDIKWAYWDNDSYMDLIVGNDRDPERVYINDGSSNFEAPINLPSTDDNTLSIDVADWDNDGDLDVVSGNDRDYPIVIYTTHGDSFIVEEIENTADFDTTTVEWGDMDGDGIPEIVVGNARQPDMVYGLDGNGVWRRIWESAEDYQTTDITWGDVENDGDLDLVAVNRQNDKQNVIYVNDKKSFDLIWSSEPTEFEHTTIDWVDWDSDGALDLAVGQQFGSPEYILNVYKNELDGEFSVEYSLPDIITRTISIEMIDWADIDGDQDIDFVTHDIRGLKFVKNIERDFQITEEIDIGAHALAFADWDGDSDLDLAVWGSSSNNSSVSVNNKVFENIDGQYILAWSNETPTNVTSIDWGDWDNDGDLDLAVGNDGEPNQVFENRRGILELVWTSEESDQTEDIKWGDLNGDGNLDLVVGNDANPDRLYFNVGDELELAWSSSQQNINNPTRSIDLGDWDNDGDLDLATGSYKAPNHIYSNHKGNLILYWSSPESDDTVDIDFGDWDTDGDLDLAVANAEAPLRVYSNKTNDLKNQNISYPYAIIEPLDTFTSDSLTSAMIYGGPTIDITFNLFDSQDRAVKRMNPHYSLDGGASWRPAVLANEPEAFFASPLGVKHTISWNVYESGFFGSSDQVMFRLDVYNGFQNAEPYKHVFRIASSQPFRVRGSQIRVYDEQVAPENVLENATTYLMPSGTNSATIIGGELDPFVTDSAGYLLGQGELNFGDQLIALKQISATEGITFTDKIDFYHTSAAANGTGLDLFTVENPGVQQLVISSDNQLMLLNLSVSLEWDASKDTDYLARLEQDIKRASEILFDLTNGQVALGEVTVYQNKENWHEADIVIYASNTQRPNANLGGIVTDAMSDVNAQGEDIPFAFLPGQIRMPPVWNRYGNPEGTIGEDWPRVLAHEIGHYALFMIDNYLGLDENNQLINIDCQGSAMTDAYRQDYSEFLTAADWTGDCLSSVAEKATGRSDWETILRYYKAFLTSDQSDQTAPDSEQTNGGPVTLPLAVTQVVFSEIEEDPLLLETPFFYLSDADGETLSVDKGQATGYLFQNQDTLTLEDDVIIPLGSPVGSLLQARGARAGARLCVYDYSTDQLRSGCLDNLDNLDSTLRLEDVSTDWSPEILVTPLDETQFQVTVNQAGAGDLEIQIYPTFRPTGTVKAPVQTVAATGDSYTAIFTFPLTVFSGHVRVYEVGSSPRKETIIPFSVTPKWDGNGFISWGGNQIQAWDGNGFISWGGNGFISWGGNGFISWGGNGFISWGAPVISSDGQVTLFDTENIIGGGNRPAPAAVMQAIQNPPNLPAWFTPVGQAYRYDTDGVLMRDWSSYSATWNGNFPSLASKH